MGGGASDALGNRALNHVRARYHWNFVAIGSGGGLGQQGTVCRRIQRLYSHEGVARKLSLEIGHVRAMSTDPVSQSTSPFAEIHILLPMQWILAMIVDVHTVVEMSSTTSASLGRMDHRSPCFDFSALNTTIPSLVPIMLVPKYACPRTDYTLVKIQASISPPQRISIDQPSHLHCIYMPGSVSISNGARDRKHTSPKLGSGVQESECSKMSLSC